MALIHFGIEQNGCSSQDISNAHLKKIIYIFWYKFQWLFIKVHLGGWINSISAKINWL